MAFGVSTKTEPDQLKAFLIGKGLEIENVECMTRPELLEQKLVQSKTMRVTVKASEHAKAMNPDLCTFRVGVRIFKAQPRRRDQDGRPVQAGGAGRAGTEGEGAAGGGQQRKHFPPGSKEYSRNKRRHHYETVGEWQVPKQTVNSAVNEQSLLEALKSLLLNSSP